MTLLLGCIADDITGATDLGLMLSRHGMPCTVCLGLPEAGRDFDTPAVVIALKIRTAPVRVAVAEAKAAAQYLLARDARQVFFKYCSTFDSTPEGNIGPVTDALMGLLDSELTVLLPAFPENGRLVVNGVLQVNGVPLAESPMRDHPLTPMTESSLVTLMDRQTTSGLTGTVTAAVVDQGPAAIRAALANCRAAGQRYVAIDCRSDADLQPIAEACSDLLLITGGSGIAAAIPATLMVEGLLAAGQREAELPALTGHAAVLSGSCSQATLKQVEVFRRKATAIIVDPLLLDSGEQDIATLAEQAVSASHDGDVIIYSSAAAGQMQSIQHSLGVNESASLVENALARIATRLSQAGVRKFVVAGGETSGAVASALSVRELRVGPQIAPGVPWMVSHNGVQTCLAFKSGNFGSPDFFEQALGMLP